MAKFSQNTLNQVAGFDGQIIAQELVYEQKDFWNFSWASDLTYTGGWVTGSTPVNLTGATIDAQIIRRAITNFTDSRTGYDFEIRDFASSNSEVSQAWTVSDSVAPTLISNSRLSIR